MTSNSRFAECRFRSKDGLNLYYRSYRHEGIRRTPILCIHGLTRNSKDFHSVAGQLQADWPVYAADVRGRGQSDHDPEWKNYNPGTYVDDTWQLLDHAGLERVIIMGTSMGGLMAMIMAAQQPHRLAGVILNDIGPEIAPEGLARIMDYVGDTQESYSYEEALERVKELNRDFFPGMSEADWIDLLERSFRPIDDGRYILDYDRNIFNALLEGAAEPADLWALYSTLKSIPTLVLRGEFSDILAERTVTEMKQAKPDLAHCTVANRGHTPLLDEPDALAAIRNYLEQFD